MSRFILLLRFDLKLWTLWEAVGKSDLSRVNLLPASRLSHQLHAASVWMCYDPCRLLRTLQHCSMCVSSAATIISGSALCCRSCCCVSCVPCCMLGPPGDWWEEELLHGILQPAVNTASHAARRSVPEYRFTRSSFHSVSRSSWKGYKAKFLVS